MVSRLSKRYRSVLNEVDRQKHYILDEAVGLVKKVATAKFDETIDVAIKLGVNQRQVDQAVRGACNLPYGTGKSVRVLVFAEGDAARAAEEAGADFVGSDELIQKIQKEGWVDFDKAISTRSLMVKVGRIGRILGPRGLMPNPKTGTVVAPADIAKVVREVKGGRVDFKVEKAGIIHVSVGKASMSEEHLRANIGALVQTLIRLKPASSKGVYVRGITLNPTMGPGVRVDPQDAVRVSSEYR